jgi:hypothetical protein
LFGLFDFELCVGEVGGEVFCESDEGEGEAFFVFFYESVGYEFFYGGV